ncbi:alpha/beta hydrolase family protein [Metabacillus bambusae]|uniref:Alpha/beta hydrolase n=1 Tax=Metabacillus bambusae TaxID=2795218 RepID=A0ABS3N7P2_9BACI|nr:alpha/beta hydrolase [Metabacillus bambusae]MBO1513938.1 alpha/beta hydrolase [Metabacillus bambusae]
MVGENFLSTIKKTLLTTLVMDGFWDRWKAHGVIPEDLEKIRYKFTSLENWGIGWKGLAIEKFEEAKSLVKQGRFKEAEYQYRLSSLYYNLNQWIYPSRHAEKLTGYNELLQSTKEADELSDKKTVYDAFEVDGQYCEGRIRIPDNPKGIIIIINPIDSSKEELFTYELDFIENGFITISFDGPGQGQTYTLNGLKATYKRWSTFIDKQIEYADTNYRDLPINLFGTSSGAAWAIYGSTNALVNKVVAVSPALTLKMETVLLPDYFIKRMNAVLEEGEQILPHYEQLTYKKPILFFHGNLDVMVPDNEIYDYYHSIPVEKKLIEYADEGHCCNYKLQDVRKQAIRWFQNR